MLEVRLVGVADDGSALLVDCDGQPGRLALDEQLRAAAAAAAAGVAAAGPSVGRLTPREVQRRVRAGEQPAVIAATGGMSPERVVRFASPVLAEREHHAHLAREATVGNRTLQQHADTYVIGRQPGNPVIGWDAWLAHDCWRVCAVFLSGARALWRWEPAPGRVTPDDPLARAVVDPDAPQPDDALHAVLRPVAAARAIRRTDGGTVEHPSRGGGGRRASVPSWDEIAAQTTRPGTDPG